MDKRKYLRHLLTIALFDAVIVNLGLYLGLAARFVVLVALREAPKLVWNFTTPSNLWSDSLHAYESSAPLLTLIYLMVFALHRFYNADHLYHERPAKTIVQAAVIAFLAFALASYAIVVIGYLAKWWTFDPLPRSALFSSWLVTLGLLLAARQAALVWNSAREGRLTGTLMRNRYFLVTDLLSIALAAIASFLARLDPVDVEKNWISIWVYLGCALAVKPVVFHLSGFYRRYWRYASINEVVTIAGGNIIAAIGTIFFVFMFVPIFITFEPVPRSIPLIDFLLTATFTGVTRFLVRMLGDRRVMSRLWQLSSPVAPSARRVLIIGAGDAGSMIAKEMQANRHLGLEPVVFLDDDRSKHRNKIHGIPVLGDRTHIAQAVEEYQIEQAVIAMPTSPGKTIRELTRLCLEANVPVKTVPGIFELLDGSVTVSQLRPVDIEDLLRREPVVTDTTNVVHLLQGKRVLVTGAGGSIGSELCRQIARCDPAKIILLGHGENSVFEICNELRREASEQGRKGARESFSPAPLLPRSPVPLHAVIADIRDVDRMRAIFERHRPHIIFHAAAHKHVPLMEENVEDAISNNVQGTRNLIQMCESTGVDRFVLISTDKAVNPVNIMGATKRMAELLIQDAARRSGRCFVAVRFGNVLGSRGSVVPFFKQQITQGGPITITDPEVSRYFMTIPEAVQLVLQAATLGKGGEIFVLDMGKPIKIVDLARDLIRLSGLKEGTDIDLEFTGLRPGEKLSEELFKPGETYTRTSHEKIFFVGSYADGSNQSVGKLLTEYSSQTSATEMSVPIQNLNTAIDLLIAAAHSGDEAETRRLLTSIVPEYRPAWTNYNSKDIIGAE